MSTGLSGGSVPAWFRGREVVSVLLIGDLSDRHCVMPGGR
jgi:hypothetical protein